MCIGTLVQKAACRLSVTHIGKDVLVYVQTRNMTYASPQHATIEKQLTVETVLKQTGHRYAKHFCKFEIKIMSFFKRNEAGSKQIFYMKFYLCTEKWNHIVYLVYANMYHL